MSFINRNFIGSVICGLLVTVPFFLLEAVTTNGFARSGFPMALFIMMGAFAIGFLAVSLSLYQDFRAETMRTKLSRSALKIGILIWFGLSWIHLVMDQWPCFLGATGC